MTHFKTYSWLIILIIFSHGILVIQGRLLKSMKKQQLNQQPEDGVPSASLPVTEKKATFPPQEAGQSEKYGNLKPESIKDFRPTAPGNSPGVGHSFAEDKFNTQSEDIGGAPAVTRATANGDDFRPTAPGHSPGGGHSKENHVVKPNE